MIDEDPAFTDKINLVGDIAEGDWFQRVFRRRGIVVQRREWELNTERVVVQALSGTDLGKARYPL